ncbi:MAG: tRNA (adenosine(37)-N6)-threonylcarbamoyltransferase complex dimerization subunit type 1 TsaB [Polaromonas sp.]|nr:tRNA (adenosine(37)-N6)-threonylcarbamoyltransferase complex dimerization subunit type 1 TsaB [Polaromonas sp.]
MHSPLSRCLAFDTSTDVMSVALTDGVRLWQHTGPGGAKASTTLIPAVMALLAEAGLTLDALDAIAFGQGPGSFTGLRTACAVAQGLAFGAGRGQGVPVLPIPTLWALAEEARFQLAEQGLAAPRITALLDARMDEMYVQSFDALTGAAADPGSPGSGVRMIRPEHLVVAAGDVLAGNVFSVYAQRLPDLAGLHCVNALPTATAMLRLAPALAARGHCVPAEQALPLYVRDKVAQTTVERALVKADKLAAAAVADAAVAPP